MSDTNIRITLDGYFDKYIFESKENHFFISIIKLSDSSLEKLKVYIDEHNIREVQANELTKDVALIGNSENFKNNVLDKTTEYNFVCDVVYEQKYNSYQLKLFSFFEKIPTSPESMAKFISKNMAGIGPKKAQKLISHFGVNKLTEILNSNINRLLELPFIKESMLNNIKKKWDENQVLFDLMNYLKEYDIPDGVGMKIFDRYKEKSMEFIKTDPYKMIDINGVAFKSIDKIAQQNGIAADSQKRIVYGIRYIISNELSRTGNTIFNIDKILTKTVSLLEIDAGVVLGYINYLIKNGSLQTTNKNKFYTMQSLYKIEENIFNVVKTLAESNHSRKLFTEKDIEEFVNKNEYQLDEYQLKASASILKNKINVLTGGPGTGKTHTINAITSQFEKFNYVVNLTAPTGKAAQRLTESTGKGAETIHRLLKITPSETNENVLISNSDDLVDADLLIVDESSMIDLNIANVLLKRINHNRTAILFVGDIDQLPPVGSGAFFRDLIYSNLVNVCKLEKLHRTSNDSNIAINAYNVNHDKKMDFNETKDFEFIELYNNDEISDKICEIYDGLILDGVSPLDIQILSPVREKALSCADLNAKIRPIANLNYTPDTKLKFITGDKVMQIKNNNDLDVYNGDTGMVSKYDFTKDVIIADFGTAKTKSRKVEYKKSLLSELELAFCITIHKSQGSDYPYVIIPLSTTHNMQWNKRLLYTAITRTKKKLILVGSKSVVYAASHKNKNEERITNLSEMFEIYNKNLKNESVF